MRGTVRVPLHGGPSGYHCVGSLARREGLPVLGHVLPGHRRLPEERILVVPRVIFVAAAVAAATAAGFVTANSPAATQRCRLASVGKLHGHVSLALQRVGHRP